MLWVVSCRIVENFCKGNPHWKFRIVNVRCFEAIDYRNAILVGIKHPCSWSWVWMWLSSLHMLCSECIAGQTHSFSGLDLAWGVIELTESLFPLDQCLLLYDEDGGMIVFMRTLEYWTDAVLWMWIQLTALICLLHIARFAKICPQLVTLQPIPISEPFFPSQLDS